MRNTLDESTRRKLIAARGTQSLRDVAGSLPISHTQLGRIERGERSVDLPTLEAIARLVGLRVKTKKVKTETFDLVKG